MAYSARALSTNLLQNQVRQVAHGFTVGQIVSFNGTSYDLALADDSSDAESLGVVSYVVDANNFYLTQAGFINNLSPIFTPGILYYLSPVTPGALTSTAPSTVGQVIVPLFFAYTTSSGYYFNNGGTLLKSGGTFTWNVVVGDTNMAVNNGYIIGGATVSPITMTLPSIANPGDIVQIAGFNGQGWIVAQNDLQIIHFGIIDSTEGVSGGISSTYVYDTVQLLNINANTDWIVLSNQGNLTIV